MIKPMIDASFSSYGVVERFRQVPDHALNHIPVFNQAEVPIYCFPVPTSWDYVDGMTVLLILDGTERKRYYLDRAYKFFTFSDIILIFNHYEAMSFLQQDYLVIH